jgi:hypothetical protein
MSEEAAEGMAVALDDDLDVKARELAGSLIALAQPWGGTGIEDQRATFIILIAAALQRERDEATTRAISIAALSTDGIKELLHCSAELRNYVLDLSATIQGDKPDHWPSWRAKAEEMERNWIGATETHQQERKRADEMQVRAEKAEAHRVIRVTRLPDLNGERSYTDGVGNIYVVEDDRDPTVPRWPVK